MRHDDVISSLIDLLLDEGSEATAQTLADAGAHLDAEVALLDGDLSVTEALDYAENLLALNATEQAVTVIEEVVRAAWGLPLYKAA